MPEPEFEMELSSDSDAVETTEAPSPEETPEETPEVDVPDTVDADTEPGDKGVEPLYELPDGRKLTGEELRKEYAENLLPDYTRKSQRLAELERTPKPDNSFKEEKVPSWKDPEYVPQSYAEVIEIATEEAEKRILEKSQKETQLQQQMAEKVEGELSEIRLIDPNLDEKSLFEHANKYGFTNLKAAHSNIKAIKDAVFQAEQRTLKNLDSRKKIPVAGPSTQKEAETEGITLEDFGSNMTPMEYLRSLKKK